jgi:hypothetical protein
MVPLDRLYARMLQLGFLVIRQAIESGDGDWVQAEIELLHNVPSLLGEENSERHRYFWEQDRDLYRERISQHGSDAADSRMRTFYEPVWNEMEPLIEKHFQSAHEKSEVH